MCLLVSFSVCGKKNATEFIFLCVTFVCRLAPVLAALLAANLLVFGFDSPLIFAKITRPTELVREINTLLYREQYLYYRKLLQREPKFQL